MLLFYSLVFIFFLLWQGEFLDEGEEYDEEEGEEEEEEEEKQEEEEEELEAVKSGRMQLGDEIVDFQVHTPPRTSYSALIFTCFFVFCRNFVLRHTSGRAVGLLLLRECGSHPCLLLRGCVHSFAQRSIEDSYPLFTPVCDTGGIDPNSRLRGTNN